MRTCHSVRRNLPSFLLSCLTLWLGAPHLGARQRPRFDVSVQAVYLNVTVVDSTGGFYPGLTAEDFVVLEDDIPQRLSYFTAEPTPVTVLLLLDRSSSIRTSLDGIKSASTEILRRLRPGDKAALAFFNENVQFVTPFTDDWDTLYRGVRTLHAGGATALYDAVDEALNAVAKVDGRTAVIVFSDGADSQPAEGGSDAAAKDVSERARASEASVYTVGFQGATPSGYGVHREFLEKLADQSGGRALFPKDVQELGRAFSRIQADLHRQYRLAYMPRTEGMDGSWRAIDVRIRGRKDLHARTRRGYYAGPPRSPKGAPFE